MFLFGFKQNLPQENFLKTAIFPEPETLDPRKLRLSPHYNLSRALFEGLTRINSENKAELAQADSVEISPDGRVYRFYLGDHLWSNLDPIKAQDFLDTWGDLLSPSSSCRDGYLLEPIKNAMKAKKGEVALPDVGIRALGDRILEVELEHPFPAFLDLLAHPALVPIHHRNEQAFPKWAHKDHTQHLVCNGPFIVREWKRQLMTLVPNPSYRAKDLTPAIRGIQASFIGSPATLRHLFEQGYVNFLTSKLAPVPSIYHRDLKEKGYLFKYPQGGTCFISFNLRSLPFSNQKIRRALSISMNRAQLTHYILDLGEKPAYGFIPPELKNGRNTKFFNDNEDESAKALLDEGLAEIGWTPTKFKEHISLAFNSGSDMSEKIALELIQRWEANLGISIALQPKDLASLVAEKTEKKHTLSLSSWIAAYVDPYAVLSLFRDATAMANTPSWQNQKFNDLLHQSLYAQSVDERLDLLENAERILMEEMPIAPIYFKMEYILNGKGMKHFDLDILGNTDFSKIDFREDYLQKIQ